MLNIGNGGPIKGSTLHDLGVVTSFSHFLANDYNFSQRPFPSLKHRPQYPTKAFESLEEAQIWGDQFILFYNALHLHSAIHFVTLDVRHYGRELSIPASRHLVYQQTRRRHSER